MLEKALGREAALPSQASQEVGMLPLAAPTEAVSFLKESLCAPPPQVFFSVAGLLHETQAVTFFARTPGVEFSSLVIGRGELSVCSRRGRCKRIIRADKSV